MRITLTLAQGRVRRWHLRLAEALRADEHAVAIVEAPMPAATLRGLDLLLTLEGLIYGSQAGALFAPARGDDRSDPSEADLNIDLSGSPDAAPAVARRWSLRFDGQGSEEGLVGALLDGRAPLLEVVAEPDGRLAAAGLPAWEDRLRLGAGLDAVLIRAVGLCRAAVATLSCNRLELSERGSAPAARSGSAVSFARRVLTGKIASRLARLSKTDHRWQTGWRRLDPDAPDAVQRTLAWPAAGYRWLSDDGRRFYADPFVLAAEGRKVLFVEEYPYATSRGIISAVELGPDGPVGTPRPVLETAVHLSYPGVFARDGAIWMIPETSGRRTIELYRADPFPDRWVLDHVLVDNVSAGDATLFERDGQLYLFASTNDDGGSTWDQLSLFQAPSLHGSWTAHPGNPQLIDAGAARPAGFVFERNGSAIRPAQDCRAGYGAGLTFCRIDRLDPEGFAQTIAGRLAPDPRWRASGAHTLNAGAGFEVIDRIGPRL